MSLAIRLEFDVLRTLSAATIAAAGAAYTGVGTALAHPARAFILQNNTDAAIMFSDDGINDKLPLPAGGLLILDITANKTLVTGFFFAEGRRLYAKERSGAPTTGSVDFTVIYGADI